MKTSGDLSKLPKEADLSEVVEKVNEMVAESNFQSKSLSFISNFNGQIIENIVFAAGETKTIPHGLAVKPKYRIIMGQVGNGVLSDIPSGWNKYGIQLINNGAVEVTATIFIVRE